MLDFLAHYWPQLVLTLAVGAALIAMIREDGFQAFITLEPEQNPHLENAQVCLECHRVFQRGDYCPNCASGQVGDLSAALAGDWRRLVLAEKDRPADDAAKVAELTARLNDRDEALRAAVEL